MAQMNVPPSEASDAESQAPMAPRNPNEANKPIPANKAPPKPRHHEPKEYKKAPRVASGKRQCNYVKSRIRELYEQVEVTQEAVKRGADATPGYLAELRRDIKAKKKIEGIVSWMDYDEEDEGNSDEDSNHGGNDEDEERDEKQEMEDKEEEAQKRRALQIKWDHDMTEHEPLRKLRHEKARLNVFVEATSECEKQGFNDLSKANSELVRQKTNQINGQRAVLDEIMVRWRAIDEERANCQTAIDLMEAEKQKSHYKMIDLEQSISLSRTWCIRTQALIADLRPSSNRFLIRQRNNPNRGPNEKAYFEEIARDYLLFLGTQKRFTGTVIHFGSSNGVVAFTPGNNGYMTLMFNIQDILFRQGINRQYCNQHNRFFSLEANIKDGTKVRFDVVWESYNERQSRYKAKNVQGMDQELDIWESCYNCDRYARCGGGRGRGQ